VRPPEVRASRRMYRDRAWRLIATAWEDGRCPAIGGDRPFSAFLPVIGLLPGLIADQLDESAGDAWGFDDPAVDEIDHGEGLLMLAADGNGQPAVFGQLPVKASGICGAPAVTMMRIERRASSASRGLPSAATVMDVCPIPSETSKSPGRVHELFDPLYGVHLAGEPGQDGRLVAQPVPISRTR